MVTREAKYRDIKEAFFPVEEQPIYSAGGKRISGYKTIVDRTSGRPLSVVSDQYRLMRNEEAVHYADYVVKEIFEGKTLEDFKCYNIYMPKTMASCRIDLIIPHSFNNLFGDIREDWTPFVRISNSYNRTLALKYEIGFCRWICKNGMIFGQTGVTFSVTHNSRVSYREIDELVRRTHNRIGNARTLWSNFEMKMSELKRIQISRSSALEIYCRVFDIKVNTESVTPLQNEGLFHRAEQILKLSDEYFNEMGDNAYAMMNVLTDYASFPAWPKASTMYVDGYQRRVGHWVDEFTVEHRKSGFDLNGYIGDEYRDSAAYMRTLVEKGLRVTPKIVEIQP